MGRLFSIVVFVGFLVAAAGLARAAPIIYSTEQDGARLGTIDAADASTTDIGSTGYSGTYGAAFDNSTGVLFAIVDGFSNPTLGTYDLSTGAVTTIGTGLGSTGTLLAIEIASDGTIYAAGFDQRLWTVDRSTGAATLVGTMGSEAFDIMDMAFDPTTGTLWGTVSNTLFTIDPATAETNLVSTMSGPSDAMGLMFGNDGTMYATDYTSSGGLYTVDPSTGATSLVGTTSFDYPHGGDILNPVPEPSSFALLGLGAVALFLGSRRRRQRTLLSGNRI